MDIRKVKLLDTYDFEPSFPDGEKTGVIFTLRSPSCKQAEAVRRKWDGITSRAKKGILSYDQKKELNNDILTACVVGWTGLEDGKTPIEFSEEKLSELIENVELKFLFDKIAGELLEENNFLTHSGKS